jgi:hypothetical protein
MYSCDSSVVLQFIFYKCSKDKRILILIFAVEPCKNAQHRLNYKYSKLAVEWKNLKIYNFILGFEYLGLVYIEQSLWTILRNCFKIQKKGQKNK